MANRHWVGGTGTLDAVTTTHWSATSGGPGGQSVPTASDAVHFDGNSGTGTITLTATLNGSSIDFTGYTGTFTSAFSNISTSGSVTFVSGMTLSGTSLSILMTGTGTYTSAGKSLGLGVLLINGGNVTLADDILVGAITVGGSGTFDSASHNITLTGSSGTFNVNNLGANSITLGTSVVIISGADAGNPAFGIGSATTISAAGATIKFTDTSSGTVTFQGKSSSYDTVWFARGSSTGTNKISEGDTIATLKDTGTAAHTLTLTHGTTLTVTTVNVSGSAGHLITINSDSAGNGATLSVAAGTVTCDYVNLQDNTATGGATFNATNSASISNVTGWNVTGPPFLPYTPSTQLGPILAQ